jgi:hypothetical protein
MTMRMDRFSVKFKKRFAQNVLVKSDLSILNNNELDNEIINNKTIRAYERSTHKNPKAKLLDIDICSN